MNINKEISIKLDTFLDLERKPVGIKLLFSEEEYDNINMPEINGKIAYCTAVRDAGKSRCLKLKLKNFACLGAAKALGLLKQTNEDLSGQRRYDNGSYKNLAVSRSFNLDRNYFDFEIYGVCIGPLEDFLIKPDAVIIVTNTFNAMRLTQAYAYNFGQIKDIRFAGMQAICYECTTEAINNNDISFSLLCSGTRMLCQWGKDEVGIGMPLDLLKVVVEGLEDTVNAFERDKNKKIIEDKMKLNKLDNNLEIVYGKNYDTGSYSGIKV